MGKITNFDPSASLLFIPEINDEPGNFYGIQYDAVLKYAQVDHNTYSNYHLPNTASKEPALLLSSVVVVNIAVAAVDAAKCKYNPHPYKYTALPGR